MEHLDDYWAYQAETAHGSLYFYAPPSFGAPSTRLWRFRYAFKNPAANGRETLDAGLERMIAGRLGPAERPTEVSAFGAGTWEQIRRWRDDRSELVLYVVRDGDEVGTEAVCLEGRDLGWSRRQAGNYLTPVPAADALDGMDDEARRAARAVWPSEVALLDARWANTSEAGLRAAAALKKLTSNDGRGRGERAALAWVLANAIARKLHDWMVSARKYGVQAGGKLDWASLHRQVTTSGAGFRWEAPDRWWSFRDEPLRTAWARHPDTRWGEWAFVTLLGNGWTDGDCGELVSPAIVAQGEHFVVTHPRSPYRTRVEFLVGEAFEGWWSVGETASEHILATRRPAPTGGDRARRAAIRYYQGVAAAMPGSKLAEYVSWRLPRLKLGVDTDCVAGFVVCD